MQENTHDSELFSWLERFKDYCEHNRGLSFRTVQNYMSTLHRLLDFVGNKPFSDISSEELHGFTGLHLHQAGVSPRARRGHVAAIRTFYRWYCSIESLEPNPAEHLPYPQFGSPLPVYIEPHHAEKLIMSQGIETFIGLRNTVIIMLFCVGLRVGAVARLNESDLIFEKGEHGEHGEKLSIRIKTKGKGDKGKHSIVPVPDEVWVMMRAYLGHPDLLAMDRVTATGDKVLFPSARRHGCIPEEEYHGERLRLTKWSLWRLIQRAGKKLGIPSDRLHPHAFRHMFGLNLSKHDISTLTRMRLMSHNSESASEIYDHLNDSMARTAIEKANPFKGMITPGAALLETVKKGKDGGD